MYGGTKEEMQRLIDDANTYAQSIGQAGDLTIDSFADIIQAVELIQEKQNIAETTTMEATKTIEGSFNMLKASWQNLVDGFANPEADIAALMGNVMTSLVGSTDEAGKHINGFIDNVIPAIEQALEGIGTSLSEIFPQMLSTFGSVFTDVAPELITNTANMVGQIAAAIPGMMSGLYDVMSTSINKIMDDAFGKGWDIDSVVRTIGTKISKGLRSAFGDMNIAEVGRLLSEKLKTALDMAVDFSSVAWKLTGDLVSSIINNLDQLSTAAGSIVKTLSAFIVQEGATLLTAGGELALKIGEGLENADLSGALANLIEGAIEGISSHSDEFINAGVKAVENIAVGFTKGMDAITKALAELPLRIISDFTGIDFESPGLEAGKKLLTGFGKGLLPAPIQTAMQAGNAINAWRKGEAWVAAGQKSAKDLSTGVNSKKSEIINGIGKTADSAKKSFSSKDWSGAGSKAGIELGQSFDAKSVLIKNSASKTASTAQKSFSNNWNSTGSKSGSDLSTGFNSASKSVVSNAQSTASSAKSSFTSQGWSSVGSNMMSGVAAGIRAAARSVASAAASAAKAALDAAKSAVGIQSPSKDFRDQVGKQMAAGIADGIRNNADLAQKSAAEIAEMTLDSARQRLENHKVYHNLAIESEVSYWNNVRKQIQKGTQARVDADEEYYNAVKEKHKKHEEEYIATIQGTLKKVQSVVKKLRNSFDKDDRLEGAKQWLENQKVFYDVSAEYEVEYWKKIRKTIKKGTQDRIDAEKLYRDARQAYKEERKREAEEEDQETEARNEKRAQKYLKNADTLTAKAATVAKKLKKLVSADDRTDVFEKWIEDHRVYTEITLEREVELWESFRKTFKKNTDERIEADKKYYSLKQQLADENAKKEEERQKKEIETRKAALDAYIGDASIHIKGGSYKSVADEITRLAKNTNENLTSYAQKWLDNRRVYRGVALSDEVEFWDQIRKKYKEGTQERTDADKKYFDAKKNLEEDAAKRENELQESNIEKFVTNIKEKFATYEEVVNAAKEVLGGSTEKLSSTLQKWFDNRKVYNDMTVEDEISLWDSIRKQYEEGTQERIDADKKYFDAKKKIDDEIVSEEKETQNKTLEAFLANTSQRFESYTRAAKELINIIGRSYDNLLSSAQKWLDNQRVYHDISLEEEAEYWDEIRKQYQEGTQDRIDADKKYFDVHNNLIEARRSAAESSRTLTNTYLTEYRKVQQKYADDVEKLNEQTTEKLTKIYESRDKSIANINTKLTSDLEKNSENLQKEITKINDDLGKNIQSLTDNYNKSVESRYNSIMGFTKLFDKVSYDRTYSQEYLQETLENQVKAIEEWDKQLDTLESKLGRDNPLYKELESMGVSSLYTLNEINLMSEEQLKEYAKLYQKKSDVATQRALQENETLKKQTEKEIDAMRKNADTQLAVSKQLAEQTRQELIRTAQTERAQIRAEAEAQALEIRRESEKTAMQLRIEANRQMNELTEQYKADLDKLAKECKTKGKSVGESMINGMKDGIEGLESSVSQSASQAMQNAIDEVNDKMETGLTELAENCKNMGGNIGQSTMDGIKSGMTGNIGDVKNTLQNSLGQLSDVCKSQSENIGKNMIAGMKSGIESMQLSVIDSVLSQSKNMGYSIGQNTIAGIKSGIESMQSSVINSAVEAVKKALKEAKKELGIKSPSTKFAEVGRMVDLGFVEGVRKNSQQVTTEIKKTFGMSNLMPGGYGSSVSASSLSSAGSGFTQNLTINSPSPLSPSEIARQTSLANQQMVLAVMGV